MAKPRTVYICSACGQETPGWLGKCPGCGAWNTLEEQAPGDTGAGPAGTIEPKALKQRPGTGAKALHLSEITAEETPRMKLGIDELDRVLGGGIVDGSLILVGGDPGIGKSTLLLQASDKLAQQGKRVLYISGEESARQIKMRANRLEVKSENLLILSENAMDQLEKRWTEIAPDVMIIDSIQTMYRPDMSSAPGSVSQIRECTSIMMRMAKTTGCAIFLVGHVTKEGAIAGPRVLEHMVDVVLYFEGDRQHQYRILRAVKNRFGSVNEIGIFEMKEEGMCGVANPSEMLLAERANNVPGSCVHCALEGTRPMLVDVQALALQSAFGTPRRTTNGFDSGRLALLLAVLEKRAGISLFNQDVYINIAGGLDLSEPAADLPLMAAVASSVRDICIPQDWAVMGEIGLAGEVRAVSQIERRISECNRLGFHSIVIPRQNNRRLKAPEGVRVYGVDTLAEAISILMG
ncbi:MAG: DNA repair protein RadA [Clostridia bacterium]|nr:DNA repair protein RadA [Clostridia bacterium]